MRLLMTAQRAQFGRFNRVIASASVALGLALSSNVQAQTPMVVGQTCDLSGPTAARVTEYIKGVDAYIDRLNGQGGVNGRPIKLVRYDDAFKPEKALENAKRLAEQDGAAIFFGVGSAPGTAAILPYATEKGIPVFGSLSGADSLRKPNPVIFHIRASFGEEINRLAAHFSASGMKKIAAIAADLPIGKEGVTALEAAAKANGLEIVHIARVAADLKNLDESAAAIAKVRPDAVLILAPAGPGIKFTEALKKNKVTSQLAGLSVMSNTALYKALAEQTQGMIISQVVPFPWSPKFAMTADYQKLMAEKGLAVSIDTMEGYLSARLLAEALKSAGAKLTRESFISGVEGINGKDVGGLQVNFSSKDRSLVKLVNITMIGRDGKLVN
jgi:branched-chain amino acid transport system substrate-binding protein